MRIRRLVIPVDQAQAGMVLGQPLEVVFRRMLGLTVPAGPILTEETLNQLSVHHAELVCIDQADHRSDEQVAVDADQAARRVLTLFEGADLCAPRMAAFFDPMFGRIDVRSSHAKAFFETPIHPRPADHHAHHPHC